MFTHQARLSYIGLVGPGPKQAKRVLFVNEQGDPVRFVTERFAPTTC